MGKRRTEITAVVQADQKRFMEKNKSKFGRLTNLGRKDNGRTGHKMSFYALKIKDT
jgi:hypothetical protein